MKILVISYYWPPSGGAGVQRWVKLTKYLTRMGIECHVVTVDEHKSSYQEWDESLLGDIPSSVKVHKTDSFEPTNIYAKMVGKDKVPKGGFSNVDNTRKTQRLVNGIRSNFFIPDPRVGWNGFAFKKAQEVIKEHSIKYVVTTSPPHSTQLVGLRLKRHLDISWVADLRDPWTDIYYYDLLNHSRISHGINARYERKVLENADSIVTVSQGCKSLFEAKTDWIKRPIQVIPNGYDSEDFEDVEGVPAPDYFNIVYTGSLTEQYNVSSFIYALGQLSSSIDFRLTLVGTIDAKILHNLDTQCIPYDYIGRVKHSEVVKYQKSADLLLLVIPDIENAKGIVTGKIFEYLASKVPILGIGPQDGDAAEILKQTRTGKMFERKELENMKHFALDVCHGGWNNTNSDTTGYERNKQALRYKQLFQGLDMNIESLNPCVE